MTTVPPRSGGGLYVLLQLPLLPLCPLQLPLQLLLPLQLRRPLLLPLMPLRSVMTSWRTLSLLSLRILCRPMSTNSFRTRWGAPCGIRLGKLCPAPPPNQSLLTVLSKNFHSISGNIVLRRILTIISHYFFIGG